MPGFITIAYRPRRGGDWQIEYCLVAWTKTTWGKPVSSLSIQGAMNSLGCTEELLTRRRSRVLPCNGDDFSFRGGR